MPTDDNAANDVQARFQELISEAPQPELDNKHTYSFNELWEKKDVEQKFLIPDLLPSSAVAVLIGEDGIGKTQIMTQLAITIALNYPTFMNLPLNCVSNRSLIVATEDSKEKWIKAAAKQVLALKYNVDPKDIKIEFIEGGDFDDYEALCLEILAACLKNHYDLIVIDALSDLFTLIDGEINSNSHARKIIKALQTIADKHTTTIVLIHHAAKTKLVEKQKLGKLFVEKTDSQGAGAITQKPRTILALTHDPRTITNSGLNYKNFLHVVKANLMSKYYVNNILELNFDASTLLHHFCQMVDRETYEKQNAPSTETRQPEHKINEFPKDPLKAREYHNQHLMTIFTTSNVLKRDDLITRLKHVYECGTNKVTDKAGILALLIEMNLISKEGRSDFRYMNSFQSPSTIRFDDDGTETKAEAPSNEIAPF